MKKTIKNVRIIERYDIISLNQDIERYEELGYVVAGDILRVEYKNSEKFIVQIIKYDYTFDQKDFNQLSKDFNEVHEWMEHQFKDIKDTIKLFRTRFVKLEKELKG